MSPGVHLHVYLNDWLIWADSPQLANSKVQLVIGVLHHLGWLINFECQPRTFIKMHFWTQDFMAAPLPEMRTNVQAILAHWRFATTVSALDLHRMMSTIQYMAPLVPRDWLRFRPISIGELFAPGTKRGLVRMLPHNRLGPSSSGLMDFPNSLPRIVAPDVWYRYNTVYVCVPALMGGATGRP